VADSRLTYEVLVVGRPSWDLVFTRLPGWPTIGHEIYAQGLSVSPGGTFNGVAALARLGIHVGMIGTVGNDEWSQLSLDAMRSEHVSTELMAVLDQPMPAVSVCMTYGGDRGFLTYEPTNPELSGRCVAYALSALKTRSASFLQCCLNPDLAAYAQAVEGRDTKVVVDCGWDEPWLAGPEIRTLMPLADIVFMNEPEACAISGRDDLDDALALLARIVDFVVVKRGADGASAIAFGERHDVPAVPADVIDATGAGDCFNAGFLYGLLRGRTVADCLRLGTICGAYAVQRPGGFAGSPTEEELLLRERAALEVADMRG
jgi:sugar/nucleoside kinase (ribokinase family)